MFAVASSASVTAWAFATGSSFTEVTSMSMVAFAESSAPSFALNVKLSLPLNEAFGV